MAYADVDPESLRVILALQLEDLQNRGTDEQGAQSPSHNYAVEAYKAELESLANFQRDRAMCESIARAVVQDGDTIQGTCCGRED